MPWLRESRKHHERARRLEAQVVSGKKALAAISDEAENLRERLTARCASAERTAELLEAELKTSEHLRNQAEMEREVLEKILEERLGAKRNPTPADIALGEHTALHRAEQDVNLGNALDESLLQLREEFEEKERINDYIGVLVSRLGVAAGMDGSSDGIDMIAQGGGGRDGRGRGWQR